jgi:hypothetical protein
MLQHPILESTGWAVHWRVLQEIWRVALVTGTGKWDTVRRMWVAFSPYTASDAGLTEKGTSGLDCQLFSLINSIF